MEKLKAKHDHKLTDILKVAIFGIFLLLPFLVYAPNALYYGVNEYAIAQEKTIEEPIYYESNEVNEATDLQIGNIYYWQDGWTNPNQLSTTNIFQIDIDLFKDQFPQFTTYEITEARFTLSGNNSSNAYVYLQYTGGYHYFPISNVEFNFIPRSILINVNNFPSEILACITKSNYKYATKQNQEITYTMSIAESMNTGWQQTWQTPMFNWTSQSVLKQGLDNFTGVFGVSDTSYFTNLIVYELIMVAIYIVIDIVLTLFKWLTHLIGEK